MSELSKRVEGQLMALKLKGIIGCYREFSEKATKSKLQYEEYLSLLLDEELKGKTERSINAKINKAKFPNL